MEKPTIYSSAPRPPKQIRVAENPVEPIVEKQDLPEKKEETASTITVMQPNVSKNNTVVKLNPEKEADASDLKKEESAVPIDEQPKDEIVDATPQADLETATDFTDNKQILTVEEPIEEPTADNALDVDAKVEVASKESEENIAVKEPEIVEADEKTSTEPDIEVTKSDENILVETPEITDVDAKDAAGSSIETKENDETTAVDVPEITNIDAKVSEAPVIETKEEEKEPGINGEPEAINIETKPDKENVFSSTEDLAKNTEQETGIESNTETITDVEADIAPEQFVEPDVEFTTIAEQYSKNDVVEEVKVAAETKTATDKPSKISKNKVDAEYDFENLKIPGDDELFQRQYYTMGEVATMFHANQSQIRFWENEFDILQPKKNKKGDRYFRPEDVKNLQVIHHLLRNRRFTIEGAREYLKSNKQRAQETVSAIASLSQLKTFLTELKANL